MSTYIMTDIHGHYSAMRRMLNKIGFSASDRLICAGDYIDRGPESYEMLRWIESPGENIILLRGNHDEEFAYYVELMRVVFQKKKLEIDRVGDTLSVYKIGRQITSYFDTYGTVGSLIKEKGAAFRQLSSWASYIRKMPYFYEVRMNGRRCIIVHGGYIESLKQLDGVETDDSYETLEDFYLKARDDAYLYGGVEHGMIIAGHTPTTAEYELPFNHGDVYRVYDEEMDCIFYDIDCGYAWKEVSPEAKLACLRLEDEKIFYI
ncbi:metallophosphoesterase [Lachnospiraceae bacterium 62-35]